MRDDDVKEIYRVALDQSHRCNQAMWKYTGFAVTINVGIWSYFLKAYIDSLKFSSVGEPLFIVVAAGMSATVLGLWRWHNNDLDNSRIGLYPDILRYELMAKVPRCRDTVQFLEEIIPNIKPIFGHKQFKDIPSETVEKLAMRLKDDANKLMVINELHRKKLLGRQWQMVIEICALIAIIAMLAAVVYFGRMQYEFSAAASSWDSVSYTVKSLIYGAAFVCGVVGLIFDALAFSNLQRYPCERQVLETTTQEMLGLKQEEIKLSCKKRVKYTICKLVSRGKKEVVDR